MSSSLLDQVRDKYHINISEDALRVKFSSEQRTDAAAIYKAALQSNFFDITSPGVLPSFLSSQVATETKFAMLLQIVAAKDATLPLRPCADMTEEEAFIMGAPGQACQYNKNRLLKLILSDGHCEIPAVELTTLTTVFKTIPVPGEKVLVKEGAEVRNGMIIMTPSTICHVGGLVAELQKEFELRRRGLHQPKGAEGAPKFTPFVKRQANQQDVSETTDHEKQRPSDIDECHRVTHGSVGIGRYDGEVRGGFVKRGRGRGDVRGRGKGNRGGRGQDANRGGHHHVDVNSTYPQGDAKVTSRPNVRHSIDSNDFPELGGDW